jgi:hypothetical protein
METSGAIAEGPMNGFMILRESIKVKLNYKIVL